jgi:hypothetical protein
MDPNTPRKVTTEEIRSLAKRIRNRGMSRRGVDTDKERRDLVMVAQVVEVFMREIARAAESCSDDPTRHRLEELRLQVYLDMD